MRILYWIGGVGDKFGGCERYNILLAEKSRQRGHEIVILHDIPNTVGEYNRALEAAGSKQLVFGHTYADPWRTLAHAARFVRRWKPDIVHTHFVSPLALPILKLLRVPLVYQTWHTSIDHCIRLRTRLIRYAALHCTRRMLAVSDKVRRDEIRAGVPPHHIDRLYLGLPLRQFVAPQQCGLEHPTGFDAEESKIILTVARFFPEKGMNYVVQAAMKVLSQRPAVMWWLVGDGPERENLHKQVQEAGFADRLLFLGSRNDVPCLMARSYVHVIGSLFEGLGLAALEAAAFGVPTVGTQVAGLDEAIINGSTGLLVPVRSAEALAESTLRLIDDSELRHSLGHAARERVFSQFDSEELIDNLLDMYELDFNEQDVVAARSPYRLSS